MPTTPTRQLTFDEFQERAADTAIYPNAGANETIGILYTALGLANEAGEVAGVVKKMIRDSLPLVEVQKRLFGEIGDVLYYAAMLAREVGLDLADVANGNRAKLLDRQSRGVLGGSGDYR